jgi:hypothetical protein
MENNIIGGIFWAHIKDLYEPLHGFIQIVGHTGMDEISEYQSEYGNVLDVMHCRRLIFNH